ncbi:uncharacterized protein K452DRAFT_272942 [Aplosporella prunicola CBS 121167]|uniref:Uncharacterized protein n=1 Tax=Aplosporella prunicola CBS 121167 TaxID=1176127 RepID=A0A6A6BDW9_9PEZI|nr:uncharacterized protein K452DRAFT_272942 [Aplosporella prunicola CBS 121167]KAF2141117.1 hypothetical protein K452DRAFT_272942 [Aplosporella prunicola CBS 121167]
MPSPHHLLLFLVPLAAVVAAQSDSDSGYIGYKLTHRGDPDSAIYETASTPANVSTTYPPPDVFLNASVHVGEIDIQVQNLTAKVNLDAQVLDLLSFNAGVDASIDRVSLLLQNISAEVLLEARLANLVSMVGNVLDSIDLNPVIATVGDAVGGLVNDTAAGLSGGLEARDATSYNLRHGVLYSVNDYSGNTHTNRVLTQRGDVVDEMLDNGGEMHGQKVVGSYDQLMVFNGLDTPTERDGKEVHERGYVYHPFPGLSVVCLVYSDDSGAVVATQVISESGAGGTSTVSNDDEEVVE